MTGNSPSFALAIYAHKAVKHASHRVRHHARKLHSSSARPAPAMTEDQFEALEDAADAAAKSSR